GQRARGHAVVAGALTGEVVGGRLVAVVQRVCGRLAGAVVHGHHDRVGAARWALRRDRRVAVVDDALPVGAVPDRRRLVGAGGRVGRMRRVTGVGRVGLVRGAARVRGVGRRAAGVGGVGLAGLGAVAEVQVVALRLAGTVVHG